MAAPGPQPGVDGAKPEAVGPHPDRAGHQPAGGPAPVDPFAGEVTQPTAATTPAPASWPLQPVSTAAVPVSGVPVSAAPRAETEAVQPFSFDPAPPVSPATYDFEPTPSESPATDDPFTSPQRRIMPTPPPPPRRHTARWLGIIALVVVVLAGVVGVFGWPGLFGHGTPQGSPTHGASVAPSTLPSALPAASPLHPGLEPPKDGAWPAQWPKLADTDRVQTLAGLGGLGFTLKVPIGWQCVPGGRAKGYAKYDCGAPPGTSPQVGGEVIVRDCPNSCPSDVQTTMRMAEEAWGLQWTRGGQFSCYAESMTLQVDGAQRYGLVVVGYWRGGVGGSINRQVVVRMTGPPDKAGQLRRVVNFIRDTLIF